MARGVLTVTSEAIYLVCLACFCLTATLTSAQVNVDFDGEMVAEESSRVTQQSWLPWSRRRPAERSETSSVRPVYLSEPWPEQQHQQQRRRLLPPPPVLSHLAGPKSGHLPSLRFPPSREQQQYQWYPRPPPGTQPSPVTVVMPRPRPDWGEADRSDPEEGLVDDGGQSMESQDSRPHGYVDPRVRNAVSQRPDAAVPTSARREERPVAPLADRREFREPNENRLVSSPGSRSPPKVSRPRPEEDWSGTHLATVRPRQPAQEPRRPAVEEPTRPAVSSRPPVSQVEPRRRPWQPESVRRPWQPEWVHGQQEERQQEAQRRPHIVATTGSPEQRPSESPERPSESDSTESEGSRRDSEPQRGSEWWRQPSVQYAHLALGAVAANEAAAALGTTQHGQTDVHSPTSSDYGRKTAQPEPELRDDDEQHVYERDEIQNVRATAEPASPAEDRADRVRPSAVRPEVPPERNPIPATSERWSGDAPSDVAAELAALSALLTEPETGAQGTSSLSRGRYRHRPTVTRAPVTSEDVIRVPLGRPLGEGVGAPASVASDGAQHVDYTSTAPASTSDITQDRDDASARPAVEPESPSDDPELMTTTSTTQRTEEHTPEYDYEYDEYYDYYTESGISGGANLSGSSESPLDPEPLPVPKVPEGLYIASSEIDSSTETEGTVTAGPQHTRVTERPAPESTTAAARMSEPDVTETPEPDLRRADVDETEFGVIGQPHSTQSPVETSSPQPTTELGDQTSATRRVAGKLDFLYSDYNEDEEYANDNSYSSPEPDQELSITPDFVTEDHLVNAQDEQQDTTTSPYGDLIHDVIGEVFKDIFSDVKTSTPAIPTTSEVTNDIDYYPVYDIELHDSMEPQTTTEYTDDPFETGSPTATTDATGHTFEADFEQEGETSTVAPLEISYTSYTRGYFEKTSTTTEASEEGTVGPTALARPAEEHLSNEDTERSSTIQENHRIAIASASKVSAEISTDVTTTPSYHEHDRSAIREHDFEVPVDGETDIVPTDLVPSHDTTQSTDQALGDNASLGAAASTTNTPPTRTRLYLFSNFPEFSGGKQNKTFTMTDSPDDPYELVATTEYADEDEYDLVEIEKSPGQQQEPLQTTAVPDEQHKLTGTTEATGVHQVTLGTTEPFESHQGLVGTTGIPDSQLSPTYSDSSSTEQAEGVSIAQITTYSSTVTDNESTTTMNPALTTTVSSESKSIPTLTEQGGVTHRKEASADITTSVPSQSYEGGRSIGKSILHFPATESPAAVTEPTIPTRRTIPSLLDSRPTFSKFSRYSKDALIAVTTTESTATEPHSEQVPDTTVSQGVTEHHTTLATTRLTEPPTKTSTASTSSFPTVSSVSTSPSTPSSTVRSSPPSPVSSPRTSTRFQTNGSPSLDQVRSAIQPFSLAEMLVESGHSLASFLRSDYTMADVLAVIERLRARREGRPATAPDGSIVTTEAFGAITSAESDEQAGTIATSVSSSEVPDQGLPSGAGDQEIPSQDAVSSNERAPVSPSSAEESTAQGDQNPTEADLTLSTKPPVRRRKKWSLAEILDEKQMSLPEFLARGGDVKKLLLEYNGVTRLSDNAEDPAPVTTKRPQPGADGKIYSLKEILDIRQKTLKQFISGGGDVNAILEEYNGVGWRSFTRISSTETPSTFSYPNTLTPDSTSVPDAPADPTHESESLGEDDADDDDPERENQPGIRLLTPAPPIYGRPASVLPPERIDIPVTTNLQPTADSKPPQPIFPAILPPEELFERINQETEAVWAAAGGTRGGGVGGERHHQVDSTVFDIDLSPSSGAISPAVLNAVIASGAVGGCALLFFIALLVLCKWRQRREEQALRPSATVGSERSSSPLDPSRININNYANAYRSGKATGSFWGSLRKSFNQRYAAAYSDTPYGDVN